MTYLVTVQVDQNSKQRLFGLGVENLRANN